jgi:uncharacterized membrane protein
VGHVAAFVYAAGSLVCHQLPERSFHVAGMQLPICARCTGLYGGALAGALLWVAYFHRRDEVPRYGYRQARRALVLAALPTLLTVATAWVGWWDPGNALRATFAAPLGIVVGAVVAAVVARDLR